MKTVSQGIFEANFEIFGCSEPLVVRLDFNKRTLETETPRLEVEQKPGAKSAISWVTKQIKPSTGFEPLIRLWWPNKKIPYEFTLSEYEEVAGKLALPREFRQSAPSRFQISSVLDLGSDIKRQKLSEMMALFVESFYETVLQNLKTPKVAVRTRKTAPTDTKKELAETNPAPSEPEKPKKDELVKPTKTAESHTFFRILPIRERRYLDDRYN